MTIETLSDIDLMIETRVAELKNLEHSRTLMGKDIKTQSLNGQMAIYLHNQFCTQNHTDGCGWFYEIDGNGIHNWDGHTHKRYYSSSEELLDTFRDEFTKQ